MELCPQADANRLLIAAPPSPLAPKTRTLCAEHSAKHSLQPGPRDPTLKTQREDPPTHKQPTRPSCALSRPVDCWATHAHTCLRNSDPPRCTHAAKHSPSPPFAILHSHRTEKDPTSAHPTCPSCARMLGEGEVTAGKRLQVAGERLADGWRDSGERLASGWQARSLRVAS